MTAPFAPLLKRWPREIQLPMPGRIVLPPQLRAMALAVAVGRAPGAVLVLVPSEREAEDLADDARLFLTSVELLPAWGTLPFEHISPNVATMAQRAVARHVLVENAPGTLIIASVRAATQRVGSLDVDPIELEVDTEVDFEAIVSRLAATGYTRTDRVEARGEFAVRGGIIDVYPAHDDQPTRIEFWGDEVSEIRRFAVGSQRSSELLPSAAIYPAREVLPEGNVSALAAELLQTQPWAASTWERIASGITFPGIESWVPWLTPERCVVDEAAASQLIVLDPAQSMSRNGDLRKEEADLAMALAPTWGVDAPEPDSFPALYLDLESRLETREYCAAPPVAAGPHDEQLEVTGFDAVAGNPDSVAAGINQLRQRGIEVVVAMDGEAAASRVSRILAESGSVLAPAEAIGSEGAVATPIGVHRGFVAPWMSLAILGEQEIAGRRRSHRRATRSRKAEEANSFRDLRPGDFLVHHHHGIGRFEGLVHREIAGVERDYLLVAYYGEDRLYIPTDQLATVQRYTGGETPRLSRMGGSDWATTRSKVRKAVAVVAEDVVDLHRKRAAVPGHAYAEDTPWQSEFEGAFPFEETPDQLTAIADIKRDMESDRPMDRLIFGDVGFGKTEVAIRGAFKAIQGGKQVAVLVPTTLLAQQHFSTFEERFRPYPMRIEALSRFLTAAQQRDVIRDLAAGSVDLVIGTHRLLSEDVEFKDLGLLIVDEEQRFGVGAKDKLKRFRTSVDVLTLTATPIPRTLEMALTGIREVSQIRTPPEDRHPILTYVGPFDENAISAAIRREMLREGQVFYVHNRIQSIDFAVERIHRLVPDARVAVAHGRMSEGQLEQVMYDFWRGEFDVLVATTIIESGLDLPQVNTLLIERADRLGLAQLYQLRGRVGRSDQRAYAYLFHPEEQTLSEDAYRRLEAIGEFADLGSGFDLAMRDLEIRGAGSILSETQAGHIAAVGFDLYIELMSAAVSELKGDAPPPPEIPDVRIDIPVDAHLPEDYVPGADQRLEAYRRLAAAPTSGDVDDVEAEWIDRFGDLPPAAHALIDVARLRVAAIRIGIEEVVKVRNEVRIGPVGLKASQEVRLSRLARGSVLKESTIFIPAPRGDVAHSLLEFVNTMWPDEPPPDQ